MIIASLSGAEVERCHHPDVIVALSNDHGEQSARVGLALICKPNLPVEVLTLSPPCPQLRVRLFRIQL
jgi:hypothetical protein